MYSIGMRKQNGKLMILAFAVVISMLLCLGCGYSLHSGGTLPGGTKRVSVSLFKNRSSQIGAEASITSVLIEELMRRSRVEICTHPDDADAVIQGEILSISFSALSRTSDDAVYERTVTAVVGLKMVARSGKTLFSLPRLAGSDTYDVLDDNEADEAAKRNAAEDVFHRLVQRIVSRMTDDF